MSCYEHLDYFLPAWYMGEDEGYNYCPNILHFTFTFFV